MKKTLYIRRDVTNPDDIINWAQKQGFQDILPANKLHVTQMFCKEEINWDDLPKFAPEKISSFQSERSVTKLGPTAVVLKFQSPWMTGRWQDLKGAGCSYDYPEYIPHVSITYGGILPENVTPYLGVISFGPEIWEKVDPQFLKKNDEDNK